MKVLCGPIVGKVTISSIRILLEMDENIKLECRFTNLHTNDKKNVFIKLHSHKITAITFDNLDPDTNYEFKVIDQRLMGMLDSDTINPMSTNIAHNNGNIKDILRTRIKNKNLDTSVIETVQIKTLSKDLNNINFVAVYGNEGKDHVASLPSKMKEFLTAGYLSSGEYKWDTKENLWILLNDNRKNNEISINCIVHFGNQVDLSKSIETAIFNKTNFKQMKDEEQLVYFDNLFREEYRTQWSKKYLKSVLATHQNLMICGEKDLVLENKLQDEYYRKNGIRIDLKKLSFQVYLEYQRQLDADINKLKDHFSYSCCWGKIGLYLLPSFKVHEAKEQALGSKVFGEAYNIIKSSKNSIENETNEKNVQSINNVKLSKEEKEKLKKFVKYSGLEISFIVSEDSIVDNIPSNTLKNSNAIALTSWPITNRRMYDIYLYLLKWKNETGNKIYMIGGNKNGCTPSHVRVNTSEEETLTTNSISLINVGNITGKVNNISYFKKYTFNYKNSRVICKFSNKNNFGLVLCDSETKMVKLKIISKNNLNKSKAATPLTEATLLASKKSKENIIEEKNELVAAVESTLNLTKTSLKKNNISKEKENSKSFIEELNSVLSEHNGDNLLTEKKQTSRKGKNKHREDSNRKKESKSRKSHISKIKKRQDKSYKRIKDLITEITAETIDKSTRRSRNGNYSKAKKSRIQELTEIENILNN